MQKVPVIEKTSSSNLTFFVSLPFQECASFVESLCYLCLVFVVLPCLFIAALWSLAGKGLASWLSFMVLYCIDLDQTLCYVASALFVTALYMGRYVLFFE